MTEQRIDDQRIEVIIGTLLRTGVILAASVVMIGAVVYLMRHGLEIPNFGAFHEEPEGLRNIRTIVDGALGASGRAIIQLGMLLLIATPIVRVLFSAGAFALERDYLYVAIT